MQVSHYVRIFLALTVSVAFARADERPFESDLAPAPQTVRRQNAKPGDDRLQAGKAYAQALHEHQQGAYASAAELWRRYLASFPGTANFSNAQYYLALDLFYLGRPADASTVLRDVIQTSTDPGQLIDARIILADCLLQKGAATEALALTYEVLPERRAEERAALRREKDAIGVAGSGIAPTLSQRIRLLTIRGRILGTLGKEAQSDQALAQARALLDNKTELNQSDRGELAGNLAWRELENLAGRCANKNPTPTRLSEAEFLAYSRSYYYCADPAKKLFCQILAAQNEQLRLQALPSYRALAEAPLKIRDHLPPPAREVRKPEQRGYYEREMKALIEKTVRDRASEYRNLETCGARQVF